ncbi:uncharacterized protein C2orf72 homolog [Elgaria multicarinata webbii]|uniref:uncharacterized protein C2orf72 homolog n=1 Tax=Elgaria multicarinata webbii TaxID=159646 RepID=UPI002FCD3178
MSKEGPGPVKPPKTSPVCLPGPGEKILQDFQVLVQKVGGRPEVLLIGETLEGQDIHGMMTSFVQDLFSATCQPVHPADALKEPCSAACSMGGKQCQLVFFLCRASCMKDKQAELHKVLKEVKKLVQKSPCALVGIIMEPTAGEAEAARAELLRLLRGVFPKAPKRGKAASSKGDRGKGGPMELEDVEVEAEVYVPGQPRGNLAIMKAACRASDALTNRGLPDEVSKDPLTVAGSSRVLTIFKGLVWTGCVAGLASAAGWYLYQQGLIPPDMIPVGFFPFA